MTASGQCQRAEQEASPGYASAVHGQPIGD
jgi:hypothetical protein